MFLSKTLRLSRLVLATALVASIVGCKWLAQPVSTEIRYVDVPRSLYPSCTLPVRDYNTIGERILWGEDVAEAYSSCITDVDTLIDYLEEVRSN